MLTFNRSARLSLTHSIRAAISFSIVFIHLYVNMAVIIYI